MLGALLSTDGFSLSYVDTNLGEMASDAGEMERKPSETTEPDFFSVTHLFPVLCTGASYGREILPTSRSLSIIRDRNKLMRKMKTPSSLRKLIIIRAFLLCQKEKMVMYIMPHMMDTTLYFPEFCRGRTFSSSEIHL